MKRKWQLFVILSICLTCIPFAQAAQDAYPSRPVEILVGYAQGGGADLAARALAESSKKFLGQEIVVINKPGGGGRVAMGLVSKAKPDGYTLGATTDSCLVIAPHMEKVPYKPMEDFTFITQFTTMELVVAVKNDSPFKTFKEMMEFARANPNKLTISTVGVGTVNHVAFAALAAREKLEISLVPYNAASQTVTSLLGGHVMVGSCGSSGIAPYIHAKSIRLLAVFADKRLNLYTDVPTLKELGYPLDFSSMHLISAPKNLDETAMNKLTDAFKKGMDTPDYKNTLKGMDTYEPRPAMGEELRQKLIQRNKKNAEVFSVLGGKKN
jgi:tripartite-type tricarboxylate transporter receptor subunit TctC